MDPPSAISSPSSLKFSLLLLLEQQILVNKHASNPAKNVLLSTGSPLLRTQKASFKDLARPFLPVMHLWGTNPGPNLLNRGIQQCQDWLSALTGDRCVNVRVDVRAVGPPSDGTNLLWLCTQNDWKSPVLYSMCIIVCIIRKEVDPNASASVCLYMRACAHVFLLLMSVCVCHGWASVQTKAPQRTVECVINLSDRQDLEGYTSLCSRPANPDAQTERILLGPHVWSLTCEQ